MENLVDGEEELQAVVVIRTKMPFTVPDALDDERSNLLHPESEVV